MGKITNDMIPYAYDIAKKVYEGKMGFTEGKIQLEQKSGMAMGSTIGYINNFHFLMSGERFTRTMNLYATRYYLDHIGEDYGEEAQKLAAQSVKKHVEYYKTKQAYLKSTDELADSYM